MENRLQMTSFSVSTVEDAYGLPRVKVDGEFIIQSAPGTQIAMVNSDLIKNILGQVIKKAVYLDDVAPKMPAPAPAPLQPKQDQEASDDKKD